MASGFGGTYHGSVVDDADPIGEHRLRVIVPEVWGTEAGAWAVPSLPPGGAATPAVPAQPGVPDRRNSGTCEPHVVDAYRERVHDEASG